MCNPVINDGSNAGVTHQHLVHTGRCRVALVSRTDITVQQSPYLGQTGGKELRDFFGALILHSSQAVLTGNELQFKPHLLKQLGQGDIQGVSDEIIGPAFGEGGQA